MLKKIFRTLSPKHRKQFYRLQIVNIFVAIFEVASVASVGPFVLLASNPEKIFEHQWLHNMYLFSGVDSSAKFLSIIAVLAFLLLLTGALLSIFATWKISLFSQQVGVGVGDQLYRHYLQQSWLYHSSQNSAFFIKQIANEAIRLAYSIITPIMEINAKIVLILFIISALLWVNPVLVLLIVIILSITYLIIYHRLRKKMAIHGKNVSTALSHRMQLLQEGFGGIKNVILHNLQENFVSQFEQTGDVLSKSQAKVVAYSKMPRYMVECIILSSIFISLTYLLSAYDDLSEMFAVLAVFSFAGLKLLPAFNVLYGSSAQIKGNISAFNAIYADLKNNNPLLITKDESSITSTAITTNIELQNIYFSYQKNAKNVIENLSINIPSKQAVGIVGLSGSGKSTTVDILLGLLQPQSGQLLVDGKVITQGKSLLEWQANIGYVPQNIFLSDRSIKENIAFGIAKDRIDIEAVKQAVELAHLTEFINTLPQGLDTFVGERGVQLSGGQQQRIGIARALYRNVDLLVLDEATSSLDGLTERSIVQAIYDFSATKTLVIIAHRLNTVKGCNIIYLLDKGQVIDQGSYHDLLKRNPQFQKMVSNA